SRADMLETGIKFIEGIPGSGKSWAAVEILLDQIVNHRRQVFTNLPMREATLRRYLRRKTPRRSENYANLYNHLSQRHMQRFMERAGRLAKAEETWRELAAELRIKNPATADFQSWYNEQHPDDKPILSGPNANWLPTGAVLIIDEARRWFPMSGAKREASIEDYASMHRHHFHLVYLIAQDCMQVSLSFREKANEFIRVDSASAEPLIGPLTLRHLRIDAGFARYVHYTKEGWEAARQTGGMVGNSFKTRLVWFRSKPHIFTLYNSHTQSGVTPRAAERLAERVAKEAGVEPPIVVKSRKRRVKPAQRARRMRRRAIRYGLVPTVGFAAFVAGKYMTLVAPQQPEQQGGEVAELPTPPPAINYVGRDFVRFGEDRYAIGESVGAFVVLSVSHGDGYAVLLPRDATGDPAWLCVPGKPHESLGPADQLLARIRDQARRVVTGDPAAPAGPEPGPQG
ncbi:MAG: zonular occludens toxin domain-containing protein, partial [Phycisphaerales bacterium JB064]